jgi:hypothetical protein
MESQLVNSDANFPSRSGRCPAASARFIHVQQSIRWRVEPAPDACVGARLVASDQIDESNELSSRCADAIGDQRGEAVHLGTNLHTSVRRAVYFSEVETLSIQQYAEFRASRKCPQHKQCRVYLAVVVVDAVAVVALQRPMNSNAVRLRTVARGCAGCAHQPARRRALPVASYSLWTCATAQGAFAAKPHFLS